jgi:hypothetical protein
MGYLNIYVDANASTAKLKELDKSNAKATMQGILNLLHKGIGGAEQMSVQVGLGGVKASGTLTFDTVIATDVVTVNGVTFACVASGADETEFNIGDDDTESAANAAATINASENAAIAGIVVATSAAAVLTITAVRPGLQGNAITIASVDSTITASAARLASGADGDTETLNFGKAAS